MRQVPRLIRAVTIRLLRRGGRMGQRDPRQGLKQDVLRGVVDGEAVVSFSAQVREVGSASRVSTHSEQRREATTSRRPRLCSLVPARISQCLATQLQSS